MHDAAGRLVAAIDPATSTAVYTYDPAGNILSVTRRPSSSLSVLQISPDLGPPGTLVSIWGTGFAAAASRDAVHFGSVPAVVISASATTLVARVPAGVHQGSVTVAVGSRSARSSQTFRYVAPPPRIGGVSPGVINPGSLVHIHGTGFSPAPDDDKVVIGQEFATVMAAAPTDLTVSIPTGPSFSGPVSVTTPEGSAEGPDEFVTPPGFSAGDIGYVGRLANGKPTTVVLAAPGKIALLAVASSGNQSLSVNATNSSLHAGTLIVLAPGGQLLPEGGTLNLSGGNNAGFMEPENLVERGTYVIRVRAAGGSTGRVTLTPYYVINQTGPIKPDGTPVASSITTPGQQSLFSFLGTAGQHVTVDLTGGTFKNPCGGYLRVLNPDGSVLATAGGCLGPTASLGSVRLPTSGTYTIQVAPGGPSTGTATVRLYVFAQQNRAITPNGPPVLVRVRVPGQVALLDFPARAGDVATVVVTAGTFTDACYGYLRLLNPDGSVLVTAPGCLGPATTLSSGRLPTSGKYSVQIAPGPTSTGQAAVALKLTGPPVALSRPGLSKPAGGAPRSWARPSVGTADAWPAPGPTGSTGPGTASLTGRTLRLDGSPLAGVTVSIGQVRAETDAQGDFRLTGLPGGHHVLLVDGASAAPSGAWGTFEEGVDLASGRDTPIGYTIWMPRLDTKHAVAIASPTRAETVVANPEIPGLELVLAPGTVIRGLNGKVVRSLSITPVPVDQPPLPLPSFIDLPTYFTVQPGGATLSKPARLIYPNWSAQPPGAELDFWDYDVAGAGWWVYGQGTVSPNGKSVVPDRGVEIRDFDGAMVNAGIDPPPTAPTPSGNGDDGDPVDLGTGLFVMTHTDLALPDVLPISVTRTYRPNDPYSRSFGIGTADLYDGTYLWSGQSDKLAFNAYLVTPDGSRTFFKRTSPGAGFVNATFDSSTPGPYFHAHLAWNGGGWDLTLTDGTVLVYGILAPLQYIRDRYGDTVTITRTDGQRGAVVQVTSPNGRWIHFTYDSSHRIITATDNTGRSVTYAYYQSGPATGYLWKVQSPAGHVTTYTYDAHGRMASITDPEGITYLENTYNPDGTVAAQTEADGATYRMSYIKGADGRMLRTTVVGPRGATRVTSFNASGYPSSDVFAAGSGQQEVERYRYGPKTGLLVSTTDPLGRTTDFGYDAAGNVVSLTLLAGTPHAQTAHLSYEPEFNRLVRVTDPMGHTTTIAYDDAADRMVITDPLGHRTTVVADGALPVSISDNLGHAVTFSYTDGDLAAVTDPLGRTCTGFSDAAGRVLELTGPSGATTTMRYDALGDVTSVSDPMGATTSATYDADGDLLSLTDPGSHSTLFTYDSMNRLVKVTDPLGHSQTYAYDQAGDLVGYTDADGTTDTFAYDPLGRLVGAEIGASAGVAPSHVAYSYDRGNRLVKVVDSSSGTLTDTWDNLGRLVTQSTPQGRVSYSYDPDGERTSMTVAGKAPVRYSYDAAADLVGESQGATSVGITYDGDGLPTGVSLPGTAESFAYDAAGELTGMDVMAGSTTEGALAYSYDAGGQETSVSGSLAGVELPEPAAAATYNADDELTTWNGTALTYDAQGQMTADGAQRYTWGPRHQLVTVSTPAERASFSYNAFGVRTSQTVNGISTSYLYDGTSPIEELVGGKATGESLTTPGGQTLVSTGPSGARSLITDRLGSTVALANSTGGFATLYSYGPFGATTTAGASNVSVAKYAGELEDTSGLYYDNARYFSPSLGRFISPDPLGTNGGSTNPYEYAADDPVDFTDPTGLFVPILLPILGGAIIGAIEGALFNVANNALDNVLSGRKYSAGQAAQDALSGAGKGALLGALGGFVGAVLGGIGGGGIGGGGEGGSGGGGESPSGLGGGPAGEGAGPPPPLNYTPFSDPFGLGASAAEPEAGFQDVIIHGTPDDFGNSPGSWDNGGNLSPQQLGQQIANDPNYEGGPLRLISCGTGSCGASAAQNLANELGVPVLAPSSTVYSYLTGALNVANDGGWGLFLPK